MHVFTNNNFYRIKQSIQRTHSTEQYIVVYSRNCTAPIKKRKKNWAFPWRLSEEGKRKGSNLMIELLYNITNIEKPQKKKTYL